MNAKNIADWWLVRVTLVVAFGYLLQNFGKWQGATNGTLSIYERRFSRGDSETLPYANEFELGVAKNFRCE